MVAAVSVAGCYAPGGRYREGLLFLTPNNLPGSCIFIDQERMKADDPKAPEKSKLSVGIQFEEMCTTTSNSATTGVGCFTAVFHEVGDNRILCFGEVDCKKGNEYLELKATGSNPA